jgi:hypothetical protein
LKIWALQLYVRVDSGFTDMSFTINPRDVSAMWEERGISDAVRLRREAAQAGGLVCPDPSWIGLFVLGKIVSAGGPCPAAYERGDHAGQTST